MSIPGTEDVEPGGNSIASVMECELSIATMQSDCFMDGMDMLKLNTFQLEKQMAKDAMGAIQPTE